MRKIGTLINVLITAILLCLLLVLFGPMLLPTQVINLTSNLVDTEKPYQSDVVLSLSSKDETAMENIYIDNTYKVDNSLQEIYQELDMTLGGEDFTWKKLFKFDILQEKTPFDGRSIEFNNIGLYNIEKPDTISNPFLYTFANKYVNKMEVTNKVYNLDPYTDGTFFDKIRANYTFTATGDDATNIFIDLLSTLEALPSFKSFFVECNLVEEALILDDSVSELKHILQLLKENSKAGTLEIKYTVSLKGIEQVQFKLDFDYVIDNKPLSMTFYASQDFNYLKGTSVTEEIYFSSLTDIEKLVPDTGFEGTYDDSEQVMITVNDPIEGEIQVPGTLISDKVIEDNNTGGE